MPTHVHFHDFLSDAKPFEEAKHKRSHGKFAKMAGGADPNPGLKEKPKPPGTAKAGVHARPHQKPAATSRLATWQKGAQQVSAGAAAKIAAAVAKSKQLGESLGREAFSIPGDVSTLTRGLEKPGTPMRHRVSQVLTKNIPQYLGALAKEGAETLLYGATGVVTTMRGLPLSHKEEEAWNNVIRKFVIGGIKLGVTATTGIPLSVPGVGAAAHAGAELIGHAAGHLMDHLSQHVIEHSADQIIEHATDEHLTKMGGGGVRAIAHHVRGASPQEGGDHAFSDAGMTQQQAMKILSDFLHTVAQSVATAPIDMKSIMASAPKQNGDSRFGPMFGGLKASGNRLDVGDEGTSEGAKKGWQHRQHGGAELRKTAPTPPPPPKPSFEEMRAHRLDIPEPPEAQKNKSPKPPQSPKHPKAAVTPKGVRGEPAPATPEKTMERTGYKTQSGVFGGGAPRSKRRGGPVYSPPLGQTVSMAQRQREGPGQEQRAVTAKAHREELRSLEQRHKGGENLSEKESGRMKALQRIYGSGGSAAPTAPGTSPPKRFLKTRGGRRWLARKQ